jgi:putative transcriptional regulator
MKPHLLDELGISLLKAGYVVKRLSHSCFDLVARRDAQLFVVKVLEDANAITPQDAQEMMRLSSYLSASPIVIADKAGDRLQDNVVYHRFGIYTLNKSTFCQAINDRLPILMRTQAGFTAHLHGKLLREQREKSNMSLQSLSRKVGVSRRMIQRYEQEGADITLNKAARIYDIFGPEVFEKVSILKHYAAQPADQGSALTKKYVQLGFEASAAKKVPFDIIAKSKKDIILTGVGDKPRQDLQSLSKLIDADNLFIFNKKKPKGVPALTRKEFLEFEKAAELVKFLHDEKY